MPAQHVVTIDLAPIRDAAGFHDVFQQALGFPKFYGRNMNAWIDCLTYVDGPAGEGMTNAVAEPSGSLVLMLTGVAAFASRCPDLFRALQDSAAFVNWRRLEQGEPSVLALAYAT